MKRFSICLLGMLVLLAGCKKADNQGTTEEVTSQVSTTVGSELPKGAILSLDQYPVVDGSTACIPLMAQVMSDTCGIELARAQSIVEASKTAESWRRLAYGDVDLLLVYEAPESVKEELGEQMNELEITPIGRDALVFIANEANPVQNLTTQQLQDIYTGKIRNWSEIGGADNEIVAFQRDQASGSQTLFLKCLMQGAEPMDAPTQLRPGMMDFLVEQIAAYNNSGNAIGYSVFYYISEMYNQPGLKLLSVDGVQPEKTTIANKEYPFTNDFYVVIRKNEPADSPARQLYNWILSESGKKALDASGYVAAE